jgi:hypothetical protein
MWTWPLVFDDPDEADLAPEQKRYIARAVDDFANALANRQDYARFIDVPSFIDHHLINVLAKNPDAFRLSEFFHKDRGGKIAAGPVWDFDRTMGCAFDARVTNPTFWDPSNETNDTTNVFEYGWYRGLHDDPAFKAAYWRRARELLAGALAADRLLALIDDLIGQLGREAPARDARRWPPQPPPPSSPTAPPPEPLSARGGFPDEVKRLKDWVRRRIEWMAGCVSLPDPEACRGR